MPCQLVIELHALEWVCISILGDFLQVDKWRILRNNAFASNSVSNREKLLQRHFRCCDRLMERIVWAVHNVTSGTSISNQAERPWKTTPNLDGLPRQWTTITLLAVICENRRLTVHEAAEEAGICKSSCHLILTEKLKMRCVTAKFVPRLLTRHAASADASLLIHEVLMKHETTVVPRPSYSPDLAPADFFLFPKWKSSLKGRRFQTAETEENSIRDLCAAPQNTFQGAFQKYKKRWERCIKNGGEYFEGDKFD